MRLGICFDGFADSREMLEVARRAEDAGAASLWFAQHMGYRDALVWAAAAASATQRVALVPTAISPYLWPPLPVAMAMATLAELAPGRAGLVVSVGNLLNLSESGVEPIKPIAVMREYVDALRRLLAGAPITHDGAVHRLHGARMAFPTAALPIYIASTGPQMLKLAGGIADGVLLSGGLTLESCRRCLARAQVGLDEAGRAASAFRKAGFIYFSVSADGTSARADMKRKLAFLFRSRGHAENIRSSGLPIDHEAIIATVARRDLEGAARLLPDEATQVFGVAGTPRECRDRLAAYLAVGLDEPIIEVSGSAEERALALEVVRDVAGH
jgi:5,10-methylenetetrahydromethanopterin reductase